MSRHPSTSYLIDAEDRIVGADDEFWSFARANGWKPEPKRVLGSSLWNFIRDQGLTLFYRHLLAVVRQQSKQICFPFRCDSPEHERHMTMALAPSEDGAVRFVTELDLEVAWSFTSRPSAQSRLLCPDCFCAEKNGTWRPVIEELTTRAIAIGAEPIDVQTCPICLPVASGLLKRTGAPEERTRVG